MRALARVDRESSFARRCRIKSFIDCSKGPHGKCEDNSFFLLTVRLLLIYQIPSHMNGAEKHFINSPLRKNPLSAVAVPSDLAIKEK